MPTEEEISAICELWDDNKSVREIAKALNGKKSTVGDWIQTLLRTGKIKPRTDLSGRPDTKKATEAKRTYDRARRLELNDRLFKRLEEFLDSQMTTRDYKDLMVSYGILEDKRSLLEPVLTESNGVAAIDLYVEELKREAAEDEPEAAVKHPAERQEA